MLTAKKQSFSESVDLSKKSTFIGDIEERWCSSIMCGFSFTWKPSFVMHDYTGKHKLTCVNCVTVSFWTLITTHLNLLWIKVIFIWHSCIFLCNGRLICSILLKHLVKFNKYTCKKNGISKGWFFFTLLYYCILAQQFLLFWKVIFRVLTGPKHMKPDFYAFSFFQELTTKVFNPIRVIKQFNKLIVFNIFVVSPWEKTVSRCSQAILIDRVNVSNTLKMHFFKIYHYSYL